MTSVLKHLAARLPALLAASIIALALVVLGVRAALPYADLLRASVTERLAAFLEVGLEVGRLDARLHGLSPAFTLRDVTLRNPVNGDFLLGARALRISLDAAASLRALQPRIAGVTLIGAEIEARRGLDGRIAIRGLDAMQGSDPAALTFFLREGRFGLADSVVYWTDAHSGVPTLRFEVDRLDLVNERWRHRLRVRALPPGAREGSLLLGADLTGPPPHPERWSGRIDADWRGTDLARVVRGRMPAWLRFETEALRITSWNRVDAGRLTESLSRVRLDGVRLRRTDDSRRLDLGTVSTLARWRTTQDGWQLQLAEPAISATGLRGPGISLDLRRGAAPDAAHAIWPAAPLVGRVTGLPLQPLALLGDFAGDKLPRAVAQLAEAKPGGQVRALAVQMEPPREAADSPRWRLRADLRDLGLGPAHPLPGLRGLDVAVAADERGGTAVVGGRGVDLDLRPHLAEPLLLPRVDGVFGWRRAADGGLLLWTDGLQADSTDLQSVSRLKLLLPSGGGSPFVDLHAHFRDGDAEATGRYLPVSIMDDQLEDWLNRAIVAGRLESGDLLLRGRLADFPFDANDGRFLLELRARDGVLDYQPPEPADPAAAPGSPRAVARAGWPRLESLDATLRFDNRTLVIEADGGRFLGSELLSGEARLADLWNPRVMTIAIRGRGPLTDGARVLTETPLAKQLGGIARALEVDGDTGVELELGVPLKKGGAFKTEGELILDGSPTAAVRGTGLRFADIEGRLRFGDDGVDAEGIRADLDGEPVRVDVDTLRPRAGEARTEIAVSGRTPVERLAARFPSPLWSDVGGQLPWRASVSLDNTEIDQADPPLALVLASDLNGLSIALPAPLGKPADAARALRVAGEYRGWPLQLTASYGDIGARVELVRSGDGGARPSRAAVDLNAVPETLPDADGLVVTGRLQRLDIDPWLNWLRRARPAADAASEPPAAQRAMPLLPSRLAFDELRVGDLRLAGVEAGVARQPDGAWSVGFESDLTDGSVDVPPPGSTAPLRIALDTLDLAPLFDKSGHGSGKGGGGDPRRVGPMVLTIDALRYGDDELGRFRATTSSIPDGLRIDDLSLHGVHVGAQGRLSWTIDATDYVKTELEVDAKSDDPGELLRALGYYSELSGAPAEAALKLSWTGGPGDISLATARGSLDVELGAGRLLDVDPGVGRMLGILNLGALRRRLSLDFSDVFETGYSFDRIHGALVIGAGNARIVGVDIDSSTADIRITGTADLVDGTLNQSVRVTPNIGSGVALATAVAGGPLVGAAVFLADKVAGDAVDKIGRYEYRVTGPWKDPVIKRVASADGSWSVGDLLAEEPAARPAAGEGAAAQPRPEARSAPAGKDGKVGTGDNPFLEGF